MQQHTYNRKDIDLNMSWRIGEDSFHFICDLIRKNDCKSMIEFGSGASTARWALEFPALSILSFEHEQKFCDESMQFVREAGVENRVEIIHSPLKTVWFNGRSFQTYNVPEIQRTCDIVVIDGPPASTRRGREACLYYAYQKLKIGGVVILDDADRSDEQDIVKNWLRVYRGSFAYSHHSIGHGLAVLYKKLHFSHQKTSIPAMLDSYGIYVQMMRFKFGTYLHSWSFRGQKRNTL